MLYLIFFKIKNISKLEILELSTGYYSFLIIISSSAFQFFRPYCFGISSTLIASLILFLNRLFLIFNNANFAEKKACLEDLHNWFTATALNKNNKTFVI